MIGDPGEQPWDGRRFCSTCGAPRTEPDRCKSCGDVQYSLEPNPQYLLGWLKRQKAPGNVQAQQVEKKCAGDAGATTRPVEQGTLFGGRE